MLKCRSGEMVPSCEFIQRLQVHSETEPGNGLHQELYSAGSLGRRDKICHALSQVVIHDAAYELHVLLRVLLWANIFRPGFPSEKDFERQKIDWRSSRERRTEDVYVVGHDAFEVEIVDICQADVLGSLLDNLKGLAYVVVIVLINGSSSEALQNGFSFVQAVRYLTYV